MKKASQNKHTVDEFLTYFAELVNIKKKQQLDSTHSMKSRDDEYDDRNIKQSKWEETEVLKTKPLFQIMYYNLRYGRQGTLFDVMNNHIIYKNAEVKKQFFKKQP